MRRVVILGPPGSGKSTLARQLAERIGVPPVHLDQAFWRPGWVEAPFNAFRAEVERLAAGDAWVIDGNYTKTLDARLRRADTLIVLDLPVWVTLPRVLIRVARFHGESRPDMPQGCPERIDLPFFRFAAGWRARNRDRMLGHLEGFAGRSLHIRRQSEIDALLKMAAGRHAV